LTPKTEEKIMGKIVTQFYPRFYRSRVGKLVLLTMDNGADYKKPTTFSEEALNSLNRALDSIEKEPDVEGLLITGKHYIFAAGADLTRFPLSIPLSKERLLVNTAMPRSSESWTSPFPRWQPSMVPPWVVVSKLLYTAAIERSPKAQQQSLSPSAFWDLFPAGAVPRCHQD
jgi:hypothetical protein